MWAIIFKYSSHWYLGANEMSGHHLIKMATLNYITSKKLDPASLLTEGIPAVSIFGGPGTSKNDLLRSLFPSLLRTELGILCPKSVSDSWKTLGC